MTKNLQIGCSGFIASNLLKFLSYLLLVLLATLVFSSNFINTASELQFRTYRDGSEALVLGKIFADIKNLAIYPVNLGFIEKDKITDGSDVLAVYERLKYPNAIIPSDLTDANWNNGVSTFATVFLLPRAKSSVLGYASNELLSGQQIRFANGDTRVITKIELTEPFLQIYYSGEKLDGRVVGYPNRIEMSANEDTRYKFSPYEKQYGLQGIVFSWLYRHIEPLASVERLQLFTASLFAIILVLLCREYQIAFSNVFGIVFFLSMLGSPWVVSIVRNLYWVPFLWFLPALMAMWLYRFQEKPILRTFLYLGFFLAVFIKCLTGYEYLPTIVIFASAIFFVDPFLPSPRYGLAGASYMVMRLFFLTVGAFIFALILHASIRDDSIIQGLKLTFESEAFKYSNLSELGKNTSAGVKMPLIDVLNEYIFAWSTPVFFWVQDKLIFPVLIGLAFFSIVFQYRTGETLRHRDSALLVITMLAPLSWFVLMKGHSAIHTHLNYVLWYFGFIPALIFVGLRGIILSWWAMLSYFNFSKKTVS